jgi:glycosyltransferase involved in cell wall biosynthesis
VGVERSVHLLGHRDDVPDLLVAADAFVFPSVFEGLGCAVLEAFALEVPVVASDAPALVEVLEDGALGMLAPRNDPGAFAEAIEQLQRDPTHAQAMAVRAHARFRERYELGAVIDATVLLYERVAGLRGPSGQPLP